MMQMLSRNPAATYRRIELDARIEASGRADLTRICLEEAEGALGQALALLDRSQTVPRDPLARAQSIMVWLAQSVAPGHPLAATLRQFYGGLASQIGGNILQPDAAALRRVMNDIRDLLEAAG
jgi:flagellin-specific chaperone FliS